MTANEVFPNGRKLCAVLLVGTVLGGLSAPAAAQQVAQPAPAAPAPQAEQIPQLSPPSPAEPSRTIRTVTVSGNQRIEPETVLSYTSLRPGEPYTQERLDDALRDLYATELFADVQIAGADTGELVIQVRENPVINRIVLEGNRRLKDDKIAPEIRLAPRQIFTRSRARADVARIIELYRRQGRYAASVVPQIVQLDQNRVDVVFEINEGPRSRVRQINIIGNERFGDNRLVSEMATREHVWWNFFTSSDTYDPDRLAFDQQKLRQFYLTQGYADFRVVSAVAELTPDRRDFIITYVVEEGERYKFGDVAVQSDIRDFQADALQRTLPMRTGDWYNAQQVEDTVTSLNELAGLFGYAFADVRPQFQRSRENLTMGVTFRVAETPRVYVERIDISGNTNTHDKVIRREFRLAEGDAFNNVRVRRSRDRIQSLGFFQDNLEITQEQGSGPDRVVLGVAVEERATGELQLSAGFSSLERFLVNLSIRQRNFMGRGQELRAAVNYSSYSKSVELGFTEPYLFDRNIAVGFDLFRRDYNSFNLLGNDRQTTYEVVSTGGQVRAGVPITENLSLALRYGLSYDEVSLNEALYFTDPDGTGPLPSQCDPLLASRYLCDSLGNRLTSSIGYSLVYSTLNNAVRPSRGHRVLLSQDFAGVGGDVTYLRTRASAAKYWNVLGNFIFSLSAEGGYIRSFEDGAPNVDPVRINDRFFLGNPQMRGFDIRGVGPRVQRIPYLFDTDENGNITNVRLSDDPDAILDDAIGGRLYYQGRAELEIPLGAGARDLGLRPSIFVDVGALWGVRDPVTLDIAPGSPLTLNQCTDPSGTVSTVPGGSTCPTGTTLTRLGVSPFREVFLGDTPAPRLSIGIGVNWNSPFGPFRIDIARALLSEPGDDTRLFSFNVGTAF
ncbi:outer membrane protein assembly factor BamA [Sphingosinicella sp. LHD-64]|uniref:outer membrane protein assembly factor BamA n=1 Tax=Sphingosinicella sp. LHD-64 TaxID=3072139 RepID=UPI0028103BEB|nr:outer membrane protein assembly factor BamA [Sphingosinicella sp. LHD-64]MDQ8754831.1 outer membrane protein assembly factor BamA [Sphingosinicella sp. LHD-64]